MENAVGREHHGFRLTEIHDMKEIGSRGLRFEHVKSGARLVKFENRDDDKVFMIGFRTPPPDNTGLPHIMEHSVLCGSRKFPSKEPFVELLKGSLKTFLNAFTSPDCTVYPVASRNAKDFRNLMDVYLDAVLYPRLLDDPRILMQEGWHHEIDEPGGEISYKGVVYNEMRGAYSTPEALLYRRIRQSLFPDTAYGTDSGGDPDAIPELTQERFTAFHRRFYHPSNSVIVLYGDGDTMSELEFIDREYLSAFDRRDVDSALGMQETFAQPKDVEYEYPLSPGESEDGKTYLSLNWAVSSVLDPVESMAFEILGHMLTDTPAAPLRKAIVESGIGKDVFSYYNGSLLQAPFGVVAKNAETGNKAAFEKLMLDTLSDLAQKGIDPKLLEASVNAIEFSKREADSGGYPDGLEPVSIALQSMIHGGSPFAPLEYGRIFDSLRKSMAEGYFERLIEDRLVGNTHRATVVVRPRPGLSESRNAEIRRRLDEFKAGLSDTEILDLVEQTTELKRRQAEPDSPEDLAKIPSLTREDIGRKAEELPLREIRVGEVTMLAHDLFTKGIAYIDLYFDSGSVPEEDLPYLALLTDVVSRIDTERFSYGDLSRELNLHTGGIELEVQARRNLRTGALVPTLTVKSKALVRKLPELVDLLGEVLVRTVYGNRARLGEIVQETKSRMEMELNLSPHVMANRRLFSHISDAGRYMELTRGISQYRAIAEMTDNFDSKAGEIMDGLARTAAAVFRRNRLTLSVTAPGEDLHEAEKLLPGLLEGLPVSVADRAAMRPLSTEHAPNEGFTNSGSVQYVAKGYDLSLLGHEYCGAMEVVATIARLDYLWNRIRVQGGAYGAFIGFERDGRFYMGSFRDPNLESTLEAYDGLPDFLRSLDPGEDELTKAILGTIAKLDRPLTQAMKGAVATEHWLMGVTFADVQRVRDEVLATGVDDVRRIADVIRDALDRNLYCVIGNEERLTRSRSLFSGLEKLFR